ncbi:MAG: SCO family protein [Planctomycetota bacterium]|nr:SCO family protein [Planctomycetota bacterium]
MTPCTIKSCCSSVRAASWLTALLLLSIALPVRSIAATAEAPAIPTAGPHSAEISDKPKHAPEKLLPPQASLLTKVDFVQRLDQQLPLDLVFQDGSGAKRPLKDFFGERPVLLVLAYYKCPRLCNEVLNGVSNCSNAIDFVTGKDYDIVVVSFDPTETPDLAKAKQDAYTARYRRQEGRNGWHFLVGSEKNIRALADAVGFQYQYHDESKQYAHASGIMLVTPTGRLSRYFYGIDYNTRDITLGLIDASAGEIGSPVQQILLYCFHYDPIQGRYGLAIFALVRVAGVLTVVGIISYILLSLRRERRSRRQALSAAGVSSAPGI